MLLHTLIFRLNGILFLNSVVLQLLSLQKSQGIILCLWIRQNTTGDCSYRECWSCRSCHAIGCRLLIELLMLYLTAARAVWARVLLNTATIASYCLPFFSLFRLTLLSLLGCVCGTCTVIAAITLLGQTVACVVFGGAYLLLFDLLII